MLDSWSANGTVAKIKYIHGRMFTKENYHEMLMRRTVPEAADYLAHSARYKDAFRDVDPNTVHRGFVEALLQRENFNTYMETIGIQMTYCNLETEQTKYFREEFSFEEIKKWFDAFL